MKEYQIQEIEEGSVLISADHLNDLRRGIIELALAAEYPWRNYIISKRELLRACYSMLDSDDRMTYEKTFSKIRCFPDDDEFPVNCKLTPLDRAHPDWTPWCPSPEASPKFEESKKPAMIKYAWPSPFTLWANPVLRIPSQLRGYIHAGGAMGYRAREYRRRYGINDCNIPIYIKLTETITQ